MSDLLIHESTYAAAHKIEIPPNLRRANAVRRFFKGEELQETFDEALKDRCLDCAKVEWLKGALIDLDSEAVKASLKEGPDLLKAFLIANASAGDPVATFKSLVKEKEFAMAELMARADLPSLGQRTELFLWAYREEGKPRAIVKRILGNEAAAVIRLLEAWSDVDQFLKSVAKNAQSFFLPQLTAHKNSKIVWHCDQPVPDLQYEPTFHEGVAQWKLQPIYRGNWKASLLYYAIRAGNEALVGDLMDRLREGSLPPEEEMINAVKEGDQTMRQRIEQHPNVKKLEDSWSHEQRRRWKPITRPDLYLHLDT